MITVTPDPINAPALLEALQNRSGADGAIVTFTGQVRSVGKSGPVLSLFLEAYSPMTETGIQAALDQAFKRWPVSDLRVVHRIGEMAPGDTIVFVAATSIHRRAAFEAADFLMDYLKTDAVFWKKETTQSGGSWIEPRREDYADAQRWTMEKVN